MSRDHDQQALYEYRILAFFYDESWENQTLAWCSFVMLVDGLLRWYSRWLARDNRENRKHALVWSFEKPWCSRFWLPTAVTWSQLQAIMLVTRNYDVPNGMQRIIRTNQEQCRWQKARWDWNAISIFDHARVRKEFSSPQNLDPTRTCNPTHTILDIRNGIDENRKLLIPKGIQELMNKKSTKSKRHQKDNRVWLVK